MGRSTPSKRTTPCRAPGQPSSPEARRWRRCQLLAYNPTSNTWTTLAPMPTPRSYLAVAVANGLLYAVGGSAGSYAGTVEVYNPATDSWATLLSMRTPRDQLSVAALDGRLFVAGGKTNATNTSLVATLEVFRPPETTWWSSNSGVATVNQNARATGVSAGTATITGRAVGPVDCGTTSSCASVTVSGGAPGQPAAPVVSGSGNLITFTWSSPTTGLPITSYSLIVRMAFGGPVVAALPVGNVTTFTVNGPNGTFIVSMQASNAVGAGPESSPATVTVPMVPTPPGAPQNFAATLSGTTAHFSWTPPTTGGAPTGYRLLVSLFSGGPVIGSVSIGNVTSLSFPGVPRRLLPAPRRHQCRGQRSGVERGHREQRRLHLPLDTARAGRELYEWHATASWTPVVGASSYTLLVQPGGGGPFVVVPTLTNASISAPVESGTDVWVSVGANNACGSSPNTAPQRLTVP